MLVGMGEWVAAMQTRVCFPVLVDMGEGDAAMQTRVR
jgi:hypothetical protein